MCNISPFSFRIALMNWTSQMEASAARQIKALCTTEQLQKSASTFMCECYTPTASLLFVRASIFTRLPTGSRRGQRPWTPICSGGRGRSGLCQVKPDALGHQVGLLSIHRHTNAKASAEGSGIRDCYAICTCVSATRMIAGLEDSRARLPAS